MKKIRFFCWGILIFVCSGIQATFDTQEAHKPTYVLEYEKPAFFMNDFKNLSKKPEKPLKYWAAQLILFLQSDPKLKPFCFELAKIIRTKNPLRIGFVFLAHQHLFTHDLQDLVLLDFKNVWHALETRAKI
jgi:hypothetical protein